MLKEAKRQLALFCFTNTVIACCIIFLCGTLTASQKTAYNIYLREYSTLTLAGTPQGLDMRLDERTIAFSLPDEQQREKLRRYLKLTPLASVVFLGETVEKFSAKVW